MELDRKYDISGKKCSWSKISDKDLLTKSHVEQKEDTPGTHMDRKWDKNVKWGRKFGGEKTRRKGSTTSEKTVHFGEFIHSPTKIKE